MKEERKVVVNRQYKSSVFTMLFKEKKELLSLYNALNNSDYTKEEELEVVTLENAIYMSMKNDLAFVLDNRLILYEHQSTPNPNLPLRDLFYVSKEYEKMVVLKNLYSTRKISIPSPHFVVFYNGKIRQPEKKILKLSDLYQVPEESPMLELQVQMLNINEGNNEELKEKCQTLKGYMQYVNKVRNYIEKKNMTLQEAVELSVEECIKEGILKEFLMNNRAEVVSMSILEFDEEREWKKIRETEYQYGMEDGLRQGLEVLITLLKEVYKDADTIYNLVKENEIYKNISKEEFMEYYKK